LSAPWIGTRNAVAFDPSFIHKSGKQTPGIGYFWSGCAGRALRRIEILGLSVIDADTRLSFHLEAIQTPPINCLHDNGLTLVDWYTAAIKKHIEQILSITRYVVADAYFSKKSFVEQIRACDLHLVSKLRDDADLSYLSMKPKTCKKGRPKKYGEKVGQETESGTLQTGGKQPKHKNILGDCIFQIFGQEHFAGCRRIPDKGKNDTPTFILNRYRTSSYRRCGYLSIE